MARWNSWEREVIRYKPLKHIPFRAVAYIRAVSELIYLYQGSRKSMSLSDRPNRNTNNWRPLPPK
jgi:hypothetical protein